MNVLRGMLMSLTKKRVKLNRVAVSYKKQPSKSPPQSLKEASAAVRARSTKKSRRQGGATVLGKRSADDYILANEPVKISHASPFFDDSTKKPWKMAKMHSTPEKESVSLPVIKVKPFFEPIGPKLRSSVWKKAKKKLLGKKSLRRTKKASPEPETTNSQGSAATTEST
jgi:hypothetical protein